MEQAQSTNSLVVTQVESKGDIRRALGSNVPCALVERNRPVGLEFNDGIGSILITSRSAFGQAIFAGLGVDPNNELHRECYRGLPVFVTRIDEKTPEQLLSEVEELARRLLGSRAEIEA